MKTYTPEQTERIIRLRELRIELLKSNKPESYRRLRNINGELWQLTKNPAYK